MGRTGTSELWSCVNVEVAVLGSSLIVLAVSVDVKQHWTWTWTHRKCKGRTEAPRHANFRHDTRREDPTRQVKKHNQWRSRDVLLRGKRASSTWNQSTTGKGGFITVKSIYYGERRLHNRETNLLWGKGASSPWKSPTRGETKLHQRETNRLRENGALSPCSRPTTGKGSFIIVQPSGPSSPIISCSARTCRRYKPKGNLQTIYNTSSIPCGKFRTIYNTSSIPCGKLWTIYNTSSSLCEELRTIYNTSSVPCGKLRTIYNTSSVRAGNSGQFTIPIQSRARNSAACTIWSMPSLENGTEKDARRRIWHIYTIRADSGCTLAVMAITGRNQNASGSDPACLLGDLLQR